MENNNEVVYQCLLNNLEYMNYTFVLEAHYHFFHDQQVAEKNYNKVEFLATYKLWHVT